MLYTISLIVFFWVSIWCFIRFFSGHPGSAVAVTTVVSYIGAIVSSGYEGNVAWDILYVLYSYEALFMLFLIPFVATAYYHAYKEDLQKIFSKSKEAY